MQSCPTVWYYLAAIYRFRERENTIWVTLSMLAEAMNVSLQAASRMIRQMADNGYVEYEPYKGVRLTAEGEAPALEVVRRHRILEAFLVSVMDFGWDVAHRMTEQLERSVTDVLIARMFEMAGQPKTCPHGDPIPTADGVMPQLDDQSLIDWPESTPAVITRVRTNEPEKLRYIADLKLLPGTSVIVNRHSPFNGPLHLECHGDSFVLGNELARDVWVEAAPA